MPNPELRGTGRTTRMLRDAIADAACGHRTIVVCADGTQGTIQKMAHDMGYNGERLRFVIAGSVDRLRGLPRGVRIHVDHFAEETMTPEAYAFLQRTVAMVS